MRKFLLILLGLVVVLIGAALIERKENKYLK
jgi:hypothetical protein